MALQRLYAFEISKNSLSAVLEEIAPEFEKGVLKWTVVDVGSKAGVLRHAELGKICSRMPAVPSIVINERIAFDSIPDMETLSEAIRTVMGSHA